MLRRTVSSAVAAASTLASTASAATASCEGKCAAVAEYCDSFVDECRRCSDVCHEDGSFRECEEKCEGFLRTAVFREEKMGSELATLQIMLGVVMALTAVTLFLVVALLAAKVKRRKRVKADHVMPLSEFRAPSAQSSVAAQSTQIGHHRIAPSSSTTTALSMSHGRSQHTVMTQLSEENSTGSHSNGVAGGPYDTLRRTNTHNLSNGSSSRMHQLRSPPPSFPSRLPSEDCVPDPEPPGALNARGGFENRGIDEEGAEGPTSLAISAVTGSTLPPIQNGRLSNIRNGGISNGRGPYTISHSQVV